MYGSLGISLIGMFLLPFCREWTPHQTFRIAIALTGAGIAGTILDSLLGALFQASVVDAHSGKIIEGEGGRKVLVHSKTPLQLKQTAEERSKDNFAKSSGVNTGAATQAADTMRKAGADTTAVVDTQHESRRVEVGADLLDNNAVNILMAALISFGSMLVACHAWNLPYSSMIGY